MALAVSFSVRRPSLVPDLQRTRASISANELIRGGVIFLAGSSAIEVKGVAGSGAIGAKKGATGSKDECVATVPPKKGSML